MFAETVLSRMMDSVDCAPWGATAGRHVGCVPSPRHIVQSRYRPLYTAEERRRRDATPWTMVQGVLAPLQFLVFAVSLSLVLRYLVTGQGEAMATTSIVIKTFVLYTIMVTGAIWEREVFGRYLFAPAFFWEDAISMVVITLHTIYLVGLLSGTIDTNSLMLIALAAYATYVINAGQFVMKLRAARLQEKRWPSAPAGHGLGRA